MEFLDGWTLDDWLKSRNGTVPVPAAVRVAKDVLKGLAGAHARGMVHRDIKPANLWVEKPAMRVKVLDFGLTRAVDGADQVTADGALVGTPAYMAPEQARGQAIDARADLFSLGVVLYRMLAGKSPFQRGTTVSTLTALATETPSSLSDTFPEIPADVSAFVERLMAKTPADRPADAKAALAELAVLDKRRRTAAGGMGTGTLTPALPEPAGPTPPRRRTRTAAIVAGGLIGLVGLLMAGVIVIIRDRDGNEISRTNVDTENGQKVEIVANDKAQPDRKPAFPPLDPAWVARVRVAGPEEQVRLVRLELQVRNPGFVSGVDAILADGSVTGLTFNSNHVKDVTPISALPHLKRLAAIGTINGFYETVHGSLSDLRPLRGLQLERVDLTGNPVTDVAPLNETQLIELTLAGCPVHDLSSLNHVPVERLNIAGTKISTLKSLEGFELTFLVCQSLGIKDLSPLSGMPLEELHAQWNPISDLTPLKGMQLRCLVLTGCRVSDLTPLSGMPLERFSVEGGTRVVSLTPVAGAPIRALALPDNFDIEAQAETIRGFGELTELIFSTRPGHEAVDLAIVRSIRGLTVINEKPAAEFWKEFDAKK